MPGFRTPLLLITHRPVESQFGAPGELRSRGPAPHAGCLAPESNILCRQWSLGKYSEGSRGPSDTAGPGVANPLYSPLDGPDNTQD